MEDGNILAINEEQGKIPSQFNDLGEWVKDKVPGIIVVHSVTLGLRPYGEVSVSYSVGSKKVVGYDYGGLDLIADIVRG